MRMKKSGNFRCFCIAAAVVILILLTRLLSLSYNIRNHPDEFVFYEGACSLMNAVLHLGTPFVEAKEYPEGAYPFHMIFQFAGKLLCDLTGLDNQGLRPYFGRLASVAYFIAAVLLGMRLLYRYLGKSSLWFYSLSMCFSLFFIEQSRYGTGDMISLMLLMLLFNLTAQVLESGGKAGWWAASFFVCGVLGAVKYPLLVFLAIPLGILLSGPGQNKGRKVLLFLLAAAAGFLSFSPKAILDPAYLLRVIQTESQAYTVVSDHERGGVVNHLLNLVLYTLLYSDLPLLPLGAVIGAVGNICRFWKDRNTAVQLRNTDALFAVWIPGICLFFFAYNLFVPVLFFRTYTPFFGILILYTSVMAQKLFSKSKAWKTAVFFLTVCMVLRGGMLLWVLSDDAKPQQRMAEMISSAVDENWNQTWYTSVFSFYHSDERAVEEFFYVTMDPLLSYNEGFEMRPGQLVITGAQKYDLGLDYLLASKDMHSIEIWEDFQEANQDFLIGQVYPDSYYYLFGAWLRGGTLSQYDLPCHSLYYRSK